MLVLAGALAAQPNRIVSTAPSITETLFALGLGDHVVGVSSYCHYPPEVASRQRIGTYLRPNVEAIVALRPDLVILQSLPNGAGPQPFG
jgi:iron complex transport system substrate-binding protein